MCDVASHSASEVDQRIRVLRAKEEICKQYLSLQGAVWKTVYGYDGPLG